MTRDLFSVGYRPFFLLAALNSWMSMATWLLFLVGEPVSARGWPPGTLHAHEMIFGTVAPVAAGFLLTAVPNWTGTPRLSGSRLLGLVLLYLAGRVAMVLVEPLGPLRTAVVDVAFLPVLAACIAIPILRTRNLRNLPIVFVVLGLGLANGMIHWGFDHGDYRVLRGGIHGAVYLVVVLMLIIAGRVVPNFTRNALKRSGVGIRMQNRPRLGALAVGLACAAMLADLVQPMSPLAGALALAAAPLLVYRQSGWQFRDTLDQPMLWILHVGHFWLAIGFGVVGLADLLVIGIGAASLHAFTAGAMGTLMLGMMPRVALGHSGRPIEASKATVWMFGAVILGAAIRILGAFGPAAAYRPAILIGGALWTLAWILFSVLYSPILIAGDATGGRRAA